MKMGLEVEYWVVDETGALCAAAELVDAHERVVQEFVAPLLEVQTPPAERTSAIESSLRETLGAVLDVAEENGKHLVPLGTPLAAETVPIVTERGRVLERIFGERLEPAKNCAGTHVHFDRGDVVRQLNLLTALDPALVSSSPYYRGRRVANDARTHVYRNRADYELDHHRDLWEYATSVADWEARVRARYEEFRTVATGQGVSVETFEEHFRPDDAVLTPVRLRAQSPTVEWRSPDSALPSQVLRLLDDVARLVRRVERTPVEIGDPAVTSEHVRVPEFGDLQRIVNEAIARGVDSPRVAEYLETMTFDLGRYRPISRDIDGLDEIGDDDARELRLRYAEKLRTDVAGLRS
ncbi:MULTISPECIES: glutamate-cysteine ligase family protein [Halorussus]|uniref:glutamate-cysteine ligase family protein n=1 Tax=Halorussus TaxID=1070314 RepID=UPI00209FF850|nr:glutamate-cysteine ligase family protein [Halorussus vallis]USZ74075.1 glutamate-cysteine ligase family protein [Halorussus vallis]